MALSAGDIAFVQYNADNTDNFAFVALVNIAAGEVINFTDNGWTSSNAFRTGEGIIAWTAPAGGVSAGTVVTITTTPSASTGTVTETLDLNFAATGDQILAYQGTSTFIAALNNRGAGVFQTTADSSNTSALPAGLTIGTNAVALDEIDNAVYNGITTGTKAELLAAINNKANWTRDDANNQTFSGTFTVTGGSTIPTVNLSVSANAGTEAGTTQITVIATASSAVSGNQTVSLGVSGTGISAGDYNLSNTTITIANGQTTGSVTFTIADDALVEGTETATLTISNPSAGIALGTTTSQNVSITDNDAAAGVTITQSGGSTNVTEGGATDTYTVVLDTAPTSDVTISLNPDSQVSLNHSFLVFTPANWNIPQTVTVTAVDDALVEGLHTGTIQHTATSSDTNYNSVSISSVTANITDNDVAVTKIHTIQGSGTTAALTGTQTIEGIVTRRFSGLIGFYVQEEDADTDGNAATSEGIFVYDPSGLFTGNEGDKVRITGTVSEFTSTSSNIVGTGNSSLTQLTSLTNVTNLGAAALPTVTNVVLPVADATDLERYEGMLVNISAGSNPLVVTETFKLGRFGQVGLSVGDRLGQYTQFNAPSVSGYANYLANLQDGYIILDDGSTSQNPDPTIHARGGQPLSATNTLRGGDTIASITGVLDERFEGYRVQTTTPTNFVASNPRPTTPPVVGGTLRVASANLLNFFNGNGIDANSDELIDGGFPTSRGANNAAEFKRQLDKTVQEALGLNADIFGYNEMENDGYDSVSAVQQLVNALNAATAPGTYAFVTPPASALNGGLFGGDEITVGFIYKTTTVRVAPSTSVAALTTGIFAQDAASRVQRPALAATFEQLSTGETFTAVVNHFKSKGSAANLPGDADQQDGQGQSNATRTAAAQQLATWLATNPTGTNDSDYLIMGDLNAYRLEDPITTLVNAGYNSLFDSASYSYQFNGQWGSLDHALASSSMNSQVTGAAKWHINADEPTVLDYNTEFKSAGQISSFYNVDPFRTSDHDPIVVGLNLLPTASLSGLVYLDADNDGVVDAGESRLAGVTITLTGTAIGGNAVNLTTTTASDGRYQFNNLFSGTYTITETQLTGYNDGIDTVGNLGGTLGNDVFSSITVTAGATGTGYNFGERSIPAPAPVVNTITTQTALPGGSTLTGAAGIDFLIGKEGVDTLIGRGGRDRLIGGAGGDIFLYESFTDSLFTNVSTNNQLDNISDFNQADGDRIQIASFSPANLFNAGAIAAANLQAALVAVYGDRNPSVAGSQALAINEAVFFTFGGRTYLTVNDGTAGFANATDMVIDPTNIRYKSGDNIIGSLTVSDYFS